MKSPANIVFILVDDMGWMDLTCQGSKFYETPNIDRLAREGMRFTDAYAACPVCSPTRASILTGKYPARLGLTHYIWDNPIHYSGAYEKGKLLGVPYIP
ncbi:MAG: sulfatase-like hydrolase/transferase, partial [Deltaproteobacteria bacterium]